MIDNLSHLVLTLPLGFRSWRQRLHIWGVATTSSSMEITRVPTTRVVVAQSPRRLVKECERVLGMAEGHSDVGPYRVWWYIHVPINPKPSSDVPPPSIVHSTGGFSWLLSFGTGR